VSLAKRRIRLWNRRRILALAAVAAAAVPSAAAAEVRVTGVDTSNYPSVRFSVVTSAAASKVPVITEEGRPVAALEEHNLGREKSVVLAIDRSQSMTHGALADAVSAARTFLASKTAGDRVQIVLFGSKAVALTGFSPSPVDASSALRGVVTDRHSGTALYDAVSLAARGLHDELSPGKVLILLTDGRDVSSRESLSDAVADARANGVVVYPVAIEAPGFSSVALKDLASSTGGSYHAATSTKKLPAIYGDIAAELARTWRVEYLTASRPGDVFHLQARVPQTGSGAAAVTLPNGLYASGTPAEPSRLVPKSLYEGQGTIVIGALVALLMLLAAGFFMAAREGMWLSRRLAPHLAGITKPTRRQRRNNQLAGMRRIMKATEETFGHLKQWRWIARLLERADLPLKPAEFIYIAAGAGVLFGLVIAVTGSAPLMILVGMAVGASFPFLFAKYRAGRRLLAFENQLPDLLVTIAASLKAGHSFRQGIQTVVEEGAQPAAKEFKRVLTETRLGRPMDDALNEMAERVGSKNLQFVINAVTIQRQVGGSLAGLFDMVAEAVRQRQQFARKIRGLTAQGRMSAYVLVGLPFFVALALTLLNHDFMAPLYTTSTGHKLIYIGLGMMAFGSVLLRKIVSFKG
jgi:tight adherence protein B